MTQTKRPIRESIDLVGGLRGHLAKALAGTFALNFAQKALMFVVTMVLARYMGPHNYGRYASAYAAVVLIATPGSMGLPALIVREWARGHLNKEWASMRGLILRSMQAAILVSLIVAVGLTLILPKWHTGDYSELMIWLSFAMLPLLIMSSMRNAALRGLHHIALGLLPETLVAPTLFLAGVILAHKFAPNWINPSLVLGLRLTAVSVAFVIGALILWRKLPAGILSAVASYKTGEWLRSAAPMMWVGAMGTITAQTDVLMLAAIRGPSTAGLYQVAARGAELVAFVSTIAAMALQPTIARLHAEGDSANLRRVTQSAARVMLVAALLLLCVYVFLGGALLSRGFGVRFEVAKQAMIILSVGWTAIAAMGPARDTLLMIGGERHLALYMTAAALLNVVLNIILIPVYGANGVAIATASSLVAGNFAYLLTVHRRVGFRICAL